MEKINKGPLEELVIDELSVSDLKAIAIDSPFAILNFGTVVYTNEINQYITRSIGNFSSKRYAVSLTDIKFAEMLFHEANKQNLEISAAPLEEAVQQMYGSSHNNFNGSVALLEYVNESKIDSIRVYQEKIEDYVKANLKEGVKKIIKRAKATAKMTINRDRIHWMLDDFEKLRKLEKYGYTFTKEKEDEIRELAYNKGVLYCLRLVEGKKSYDPQRARRLYAIAVYNAHILGKELPILK